MTRPTPLLFSQLNTMQPRHTNTTPWCTRCLGTLVCRAWMWECTQDCSPQTGVLLGCLKLLTVRACCWVSSWKYMMFMQFDSQLPDSSVIVWKAFQTLRCLQYCVLYHIPYLLIGLKVWIIVWYMDPSGTPQVVPVRLPVYCSKGMHYSLYLERAASASAGCRHLNAWNRLNLKKAVIN